MGNTLNVINACKLKKLSFWLLGHLSDAFVCLFASLSGLQDSLASMTDLHAAQQLLLVGGHTLEEVVLATTEIAQFPMHVQSSIIYLYPCEMVTSEVPHLQQPEIRK